ncbi:MAG: thiamine phosphate synthase, partial [Pseudomonadota bacterium]
MTAPLDPFYPIVDSAEWVARLLPLGAKLIQLRVKDTPELEVREQIAFSRDLCRAHSAVLVVNDYWQAAIDLKCDFIHLGQEDLDDADLAAIRRAGLRLGVSTHDHTELDRGLSTDP